MILVTGATGKIGTEVVRALREAGEPVRAFVRTPEKAAALAGLGAELAKGDLGDPPSLDAALRGCDRLFLLSVGDERQVALQGYAIQAARRASVGHVVKLSVLGASFAAKVGLARWHAATEAELAASGLGFTVLQPGFFLQNLFSHVPTIKKDGVFYGCQGAGRTAMIDTRDIAAAAAAILRKPGPHLGKSYVLTGPEPLSLAEVADRFSAALGKPVKYVDVGPEAMTKTMLGFGMPVWLVNDLVALAQLASTGFGGQATDAVRHLLGRAPRGVDEFLRDFQGAFR